MWSFPEHLALLIPVPSHSCTGAALATSTERILTNAFSCDSHVLLHNYSQRIYVLQWSLTLIIALNCHLMSNCIQQVSLTPCSNFRVAGEGGVGEPVMTAVTDPTAGYSKLCSLPGILLVVAHHGVFLFNPDTLARTPH